MNRIADYRKQVGLTQSEAGQLVKWRQGRWSSYETGARTPDLSDIKKILAVLNGCGANASFESLFPMEASAA
jgi:putative transcriptional regulator